MPWRKYLPNRDIRKRGPLSIFRINFSYKNFSHKKSAEKFAEKNPRKNSHENYTEKNPRKNSRKNSRKKSAEKFAEKSSEKFAKKFAWKIRGKNVQIIDPFLVATKTSAFLVDFKTFFEGSISWNRCNRNLQIKSHLAEINR
jgi:hypothetical protein